MRRFINLNSLLYVSLVLSLAASLTHVAYAFATVNSGDMVQGYISAVAVDLGLLALAAGINQRKRQRRSTRPLWFGVIFFSLISTYANWLSGITHLTLIEAEVSPIGSFLIALRPILLSGVLPILVIYLSEIVSGNHEQAQKEQAQIIRKAQKSDPNRKESPINGVSIEKAHAGKRAQIETRHAQMRPLLAQGMTQPDMADELGVSLSTVKRDVALLTNGNAEVSSE